MSPIFVNDNDHPVRVDRPNELTGAAQLQRIVPGQAVEADGKYADNLAVTPGVREGSEDELEAYRESTAAKAVTPGARLAQKMALGPLRKAVRIAATVAPLQRVVGDDAAPYGPGSGEVTTAVDAARDDREHFMPGDVLPEEKVAHAGTPAASLPLSQEPSSEEIHNAQANATEEADEVAQAWLEVGQTAPEELAAHFSPQPPEREAGPHEDADHFDGDGDELKGDALEEAGKQAGHPKLGDRPWSDLNADEKRQALADNKE